MSRSSEQSPQGGFRARLHTIIFEADTPAGKAFDVALLWAIVFSIAAVMLESVSSIRVRYASALQVAEWFFTIIFALEYVLRLIAVRRPLDYARSFFGLVDLLAILPSFLSVIFPGAQTLLVVRVLRLLRVFRVLKLGHLLGQAEVLLTALRASRGKIIVFLGFVLTVDVVMGAIMYLVEGEQHGFDSIPRSMYWAIVTMTTVGFGDITPKTVPGQFIASVLMIMGYGILAVPTGIVSVELAAATKQRPDTQACPGCGAQGHDLDARYCKTCGTALDWTSAKTAG
ncbi:ion transporter [Myxococcus llanfairpwllgwyngyllgogerychwyrndrobwllllantysiliogogogochensis]|uniref:Ion transporter n=1 Tax=Myxococcus llanfairpwllgwyngyllgogerychwyrndrobwllllantysiliogogogochensis TaxID=2590453 RepID=A0A540WYS8_9BACT|nr:ion transporter [Myxococcus llanfairpwllgwyngyllgogerychwyrndrobwllllantysiliogogogochensis]NTX01281.1 ion transporter [Myxococcus sp. CA040A]NTX12011.1 ion transporter [Myxococcus sp. CA056]NTX33028.1 ion transporter [Myxococcus sp. CA033]TQF14110.1 ion transporter [Myxococcus llanfairpwllgwyngyllgogerychwyrndrobwllllantysiliogogogochensis]